MSELKKQLLNYEKDKAGLGAMKTRLRTVTADHKSLEWEHEVLEQRFEKVQKERDELYRKFVICVLACVGKVS